MIPCLVVISLLFLPPFIFFLVLVHRAPTGEEIPGIGFVRTDRP